MEQCERSWRSSRPRRSATTIPLENSEEPEPVPEPEPQVAQKKQKQPPAKAPTAAEKASKARKSKPSQQQKSKSNVTKPPVACKESGGDCGDYWGDYDYDASRDDDNDEEEVVVVSPNTKHKIRKARECVARKEKAQVQAHKDPPSRPAPSSTLTCPDGDQQTIAKIFDCLSSLTEEVAKLKCAQA